MDSKVSELLKVNTLYKNHTIELCERIESLLNEEVTRFIGPNVIPNRFDVELEMAKTLQTFIEVNKILWSSTQRLSRNLDAINSDLPPEPDSANERRDSNPFNHISNFNAEEFQEPPERLKEEPTNGNNTDKLESFLRNDIPLDNTSSNGLNCDEFLDRMLKNAENPEEHPSLLDVKVEMAPEFEPTCRPQIAAEKGVANEEESDESDASEPKTEQKELEESQSEPKQGTAYSAVCKLVKDWQEQKAADEKKEQEKIKSKSVTFQLTPYVPEDVPTNGGVSLKKKRKEKKIVHYKLEEDTLASGQMCFFLHIKTPGEFYVCTNRELLDSLKIDIQDTLSSCMPVINHYKSKEEAKTCLGNFCFGFIVEKNTWFRVNIIDWMEMQGDHVLVQLVDVGQVVQMPYRYLRAMNEYFADVPQLAIRCHLAELIPTTPTPNWPPQAAHALYQLQLMKYFVVVYAHKQANSYAVDLRDTNEDQLTVAEAMIKCGMAIGPADWCVSDTESHEDETNTADNAEPDRDVFISDEDLLEPDNINEAVAGYDARDEARICRFTQKNGRCYKGPRCPLEHRYFAPDGITTDKALVTFQANNTILLPKPGDMIKIRPMAYINSCRFYAHVFRNTEEDCTNAELEKLQTLLNKNNIVANYVEFKIDPAMGEMVLVKHQNAWYRGKYVDLAENDRLEIFLLDFGGKVLKKRSELRQMNDDFLHVPFQAVECVLNGCSPWKHASSVQCLDFWEKQMARKILLARTICVSPLIETPRLTLDVLATNGNDLVAILITCGVVRPESSAADVPADSILQTA